jgi:hypothetical protein
MNRTSESALNELAGGLIPTSGNVADVLEWAARHQRAADLERDVAA